MKALYCQECRDVVTSWKRIGRACACSRHIVWGVREPVGGIAVHDRRGEKSRAFVLRFSTDILKMDGPTDADSIRQMLETCPSRHLREQNSLIVRSEIGSAPDIVWSDEPPRTEVEFTRSGPRVVHY